MLSGLSARIKLSHRILSLVALSAVSLVLISAYLLTDMRHDLVVQKREMLRALVESASGVAQSYHARAEAGEMSEEEAQRATLDAIQGMRYGDSDYLWVNDMQNVMVMHPIKPELIGRDLSTLEDPSGFRFFEAFITVVRADGGGFVPYLWPKPGFEEPIEKESYVAGFAPWGWVIGTGIYIDDLNAIFWQRVQSIGAMVGLVFIGMIALSVVVARSITKPVQSMTDCMRQLADGDLDVDIPARDRGDELGAMAAAVDVFKTNAHERLRLEKEQEAADARAKAEKRQAMLDLADGFQSSVEGVVDSVSSAAGELNSTAESMSEMAKRNESQSAAASSASDHASHNVQALAAAAEELSCAIQEISRQVTQSTAMTREAADSAQRTNVEVEGLVEAASRINEVISLISDIAEQTNLLALNATIEAARAGEAGKGFAVVASEVKNLANQTAKATEDISEQIHGIQQATTGACDAIRAIGEIIARVDEVAGSIAAAVEEQTVATQEIAQNVQEASAGVSEVSQNLVGVAEVASETGGASGQVLQSATGLSQQSDVLRREIERFLSTVRAA